LGGASDCALSSAAGKGREPVRHHDRARDLTLAAIDGFRDQLVQSSGFKLGVNYGRPPSPDELSGSLELDRHEVLAGLRELHDAHAIVLTGEGDAIRMAHPFSAWPMNFVVSAPEDDRLWWGGCAWDSFGIVAAMGERLDVQGCG